MITSGLVVARKEWRDSWRDRRTLLAAFAYTIFGPLILALLLGFLANSEERPKNLVVAVVGAESAPALMRGLENQGLEVVPLSEVVGAPSLPEGADALLEVPKVFAANYSASRPAPLRLYADSRNSRQSAAAREVQQAVEALRSQVVAGRLVARGVAPSVAQPLFLSHFDLSTTSRRGQAFSGMLILFFVLAPFFSGLSLAVEATAGERERGSLQPLVAQPIAPWPLVVGKWIVVFLFTLAGTVLTVLLGVWALSLSPLGALGIRVHLDWATAAGMGLVLLPLTVVVSSLQMWIATTARSFKEGQTYLTLLGFVPALFGFVHAFSQGGGESLLAWFPIFLELRLLEGLLLGGAMDWPAWAAAAATSAALACLFLTALARQFGGERVLA